MGAQLFRSIGLFLKEWADLNRLLDYSNKAARALVFYSEKDIYYQYFEGLIDAILKNSDLDICYITSDHNDPILQAKDTRIRPFYLDKCLPLALGRLDSKALVMTMTDLGQFHIKKAGTSRPGIEHIYIFHAMVSTHLQYRLGAFDHYDTIFCVGPYHVEEIRQTEGLYHLKPKRLLPIGYGRLEKIYKDHQEFLRNDAGNHGTKKTVLIAPTWGDQCILHTCIDEILSALKRSDLKVVIRPHPEFVKCNKGVVDDIGQKIKDMKDFTLELDLLSDRSLHEADVLITDRSGIAFEYAFGTDRPVLFINTPPKVNNPEFQKLKTEPIENKLRNTIGVSVELGDIGALDGEIRRLISGRETYAEKIRNSRNEYIFNWMNSSRAGADHIIGLYKESGERA